MADTDRQAGTGLPHAKQHRVKTGLGWFEAVSIAIAQIVREWSSLWVLTKYSLVRSVSGQHLGIVWWFAEPLINATIFYFVVVLIFSRGGPDYHFTLITGLFCWTLFASTLRGVTNSLTGNANFLLRGIFPPMVAVLAPLTTSLILAYIAFAMVLVFMPYDIGLNLLCLPLVLFLQVIIALAIGLPLAILNIRIPDVSRFVQFFTRFGWFMSPILYPVSRVLDAERIPEWFKSLYVLNPMVHTLNLLRYSFDGILVLPLTGLFVWIGVAFALVLVGISMIVKFQNSYMKRL